MDNDDLGVTAAEIWDTGSTALRAQLAPQTWGMWFQGVHAVGLDGDVLTLAVPNPLAAERIRSSYSGMLADTLRDVTGHDMHVELTVATESRVEEPVHVAPTTGGSAPGIDDSMLLPPPPDPTNWASGNLNPRYTFDQFVIGASNRFAHAAALSVAESPARSYNPLFIYGPAGLGKTHLLHAIGHHVQAVFRNKRVRYVSTETFMNEFVEAIRTKAMPAFKRRYRDLDVLLIDDIQFLERTQELQEEFFHTFNQLHNERGQIVISSDRPPKSIATLEDRLRSRFEWGLITDVQPPEFETRLAILRKKAESEHLEEIPDDVLAFIASNISDNVRELEGALIRVAAYSSLNRAELTEEVAAPGARRPAAAHPAAGDHPRAHPRRDRQDVRLDGRGPVRQEPAPAARHRPPDRHVRLPRAHRLQLPPHRRAVRRPRPHDRHVRGREDQAADDRAARHVRPGQRAHRAASSSAPVDKRCGHLGTTGADWGRPRRASR